MNNACANCGFFAKDISEWSRWDGTVHRTPDATSSGHTASAVVTATVDTATVTATTTGATVTATVTNSGERMARARTPAIRREERRQRPYPNRIHGFQMARASEVELEGHQSVQEAESSAAHAAGAVATLEGSRPEWFATVVSTLYTIFTNDGSDTFPLEVFEEAALRSNGDVEAAIESLLPR